MKDQLVKVTTPNRMLFIRGKLSRTPLEVIIKHEPELNLLKSSMLHQGIKFTTENYIPMKVKNEKQLKNIVSKKKESIKKKITKPKTILEKISNEEN